MALTVPMTYAPVLEKVTTFAVPETETMMLDPDNGILILLVPFDNLLPALAVMPVSKLPSPMKYPALMLPVVVIIPLELSPPVPK